MKILLTGATGFIGSHIFDLLQMEESYIRVISRPESAKNLKQNFPSEQIIITDNLLLDWYFRIPPPPPHPPIFGLPSELSEKNNLFQRNDNPKYRTIFNL